MSHTHTHTPFKRSRGLIEISSKITGQCLTSVLYQNLSRRWWQLNEFISHEGLLNVNQSAYKNSHSTETSLLKIQNNIAFSVDSGKAVALTLLDLSAAFDTIVHSLLYDCLHGWFGLDGTVLLWIKSYLFKSKTKN